MATAAPSPGMGGRAVSAPGAAPWAAGGYVTESPYMRQFLREQAPLNLAFAARANGFPAPAPDAPFRYCDLGCGEGVTLLLLAASHPHAEFVGVDMNPEHIAHARDMARRGGLANVTFLEAEFGAPGLDELGEFEFVAAHGVASWISPEAAAALFSSVDKLLRPGGLFYFCHYVRPGAAKMEALFQLLQSLMEGREGTLEDRALAAIAEARALMEAEAPLFKRYASLKADLDELEQRDRRYLVHEYCNRYFRAAFVGDLFEELGQFGLHHVASARLARNDVRNVLGERAADMLAGLDWETRETRVSLLSHETFRWDVMRRAAPGEAPPAPGPAEIDDFLLDAAIYPYRFKRTARLGRREVGFDTPEFRAIIDLACEGRRSIGAIRTAEVLARFDAVRVNETLQDIVSAGCFRPILAPPHPKQPLREARMRFTHPLSVPLWERDAVAEGICSFPSRCLGSALTLAGFSALVAGHLDGATLAEAQVAARARHATLTAAETVRLRLDQPGEDGGFDAPWERFCRTDLPRLLKYGVIEQR